ncbi:MAG: choice-of-anchor Q domain-containing protein [Chloroflexales bacterium]
MSPSYSPAQRYIRAVSSALMLFALLITYMSLTPVPLAHAATIVRVKPGGTGNGSSWATAKDLAPALLSARDGAELWVAAGSYTPTTTDVDPRIATFTMKSNVAIYGGFAGSETQRSERNWVTNVVILSGDLLGNDNSTVSATEPTRRDNSYHVVTGATSAILDGVTISGGNANMSGNSTGGGMYNYVSTPTLTNVTFSHNIASTSGGGMYIRYTRTSPLTLTNVAFSGNIAFDGGGIYNFSSNPTLTNVTFNENRASGSGGGMYNFNSSPWLVNATISGNSASDGGGVYNDSSSPTFTNVTISGNSATHGNGGGMSNSGNPTLYNVTISGNSASASGGGTYNHDSITIQNSILWGNAAISGAEIFDANAASTVNYSLGVWGYVGTGNLDTDPLFIAPIDATSAPTTTGDYRLQAASPAINAGDNSANTTPTDLDGNPRIIEGTMDMGAYEYVPVIPKLDIDYSTGQPGSSFVITGNKFPASTLLNVTINGRSVPFSSLSTDSAGAIRFVITTAADQMLGTYKLTVGTQTTAQVQLTSSAVSNITSIKLFSNGVFHPDLGLVGTPLQAIPANTVPFQDVFLPLIRR